jgi:hypothetical protein
LRFGVSGYKERIGGECSRRCNCAKQGREARPKSRSTQQFHAESSLMAFSQRFCLQAKNRAGKQPGGTGDFKYGGAVPTWCIRAPRGFKHHHTNQWTSAGCIRVSKGMLHCLGFMIIAAPPESCRGPCSLLLPGCWDATRLNNGGVSRGGLLFAKTRLTKLFKFKKKPKSPYFD